VPLLFFVSSRLKEAVSDDKLFEAFTKHTNTERDKKVLSSQGGGSKMDASLL
jgi:hypothetical protein